MKLREQEENNSCQYSCMPMISHQGFSVFPLLFSPLLRLCVDGQKELKWKYPRFYCLDCLNRKQSNKILLNAFTLSHLGNLFSSLQFGGMGETKSFSPFLVKNIQRNIYEMAILFHFTSFFFSFHLLLDI